MSKKTLKTWEVNLNQLGIDSETRDIYLTYISTLLNNKIPIIFDFTHLSKLLGRTNSYLSSVVNSSHHHYREFKIPKRKGGHRVISAPYSSLMECQEWISSNILSKVKIHMAAHGFSKKKSIISNSKIHVNNHDLLKIDLKDFFTSIKINRIIPIFQKLGYTNKVAFYLSAICCINKHLPQGAPTSPILSNIVSKQLDNRLFKLSRNFGFNYTRYADDLAFSGTNIPPIFIKYIRDIIEDEGFEVNENKVFLHNKSNQQKILTGISISSGELKVPKVYKRKIQQEYHYIKKHGLFSHMLTQKIKNPNYLESLIGKFRFFSDVEKDNKFAKEALQYLENLSKKLKDKK